MIDALIYTPSFSAFAAHLDSTPEHRNMLQRDENGEMVMPPVVIGMERTPAAMTDDEIMAYCRFTRKQADEWRGMNGVEILGEAEFTGPGTADKVYAQVFDDPAKYEIYCRVYPHEPYDMVTGEVYTLSASVTNPVEVTVNIDGEESTHLMANGSQLRVEQGAVVVLVSEHGGATLEGPVDETVTITPPTKFGIMAGA